MKMKTILLAGALGLGAVNLASAATVQYVYLTGSTAARTASYNALNSLNVWDSAPTFVGFGNSTASKSTYMIFSNSISSQPIIVKCLWSGSEAGIADVSSSAQEPFLNDPGQGGVPDPGPGGPPSVTS